MCELIPSFLKKNAKKYGIPIAVILVCLVIFYISKQSSIPPQDELFSTIQDDQQSKMEKTDTKEENNKQQDVQKQGVVASTSIMVDVKGAVKNPGVYQLDADSRVIDAILLAGGYAKNAQSRQINHAQKLNDEML